MASTPADDPRQQLLELLSTLSFRLGDFTLSSGQKSDYYIDCRTTTLHAQGGRLAGMLLYELLEENFPEAVAVGGLTMGADPLVSNIASSSAWALSEFTEVHRLAEEMELDSSDPLRELDEPRLVHGFLVRKAEKTHGTGRRIEGFVQPGAQVVIVDDVCTTGGSTITAIEAAREAGMHVLGVLCLVDRQQGGREAIEAALGPDGQMLTLFTTTEIRAVHTDLHTAPPDA